MKAKDRIRELDRVSDEVISCCAVLATAGDVRMHDAAGSEVAVPPDLVRGIAIGAAVVALADRDDLADVEGGVVLKEMLAYYAEGRVRGDGHE